MKARLKKILADILNFITCLTGDNVSIYAAQASFFLVISVIPFMMFIMTIAKPFIDFDPELIIHTINSFAPREISSLATVVINELFDKTSSISAISITAATALWLSSRGIMALTSGLSNVYHLPVRNYFYRRLVSVVYTLAFIATLILTIIFFGFGNKIEEYISGRSIILSDIMQLLIRGKIMIFLVYLTLIFALFYHFLARSGLKFREQIPGAVFSAVGWLIFSHIYSIYIENYSSYTFVYGSLAAIVLMMLWLYFCMNIFLYGAQINKMINRRKNTERMV